MLWISAGGGALVQEPAKIEILSKDDARAIFAMTRAEWVENVRRAVMAGAAKATGSPDSGGVTMHTSNQTGHLSVRPDYSDDGRPDFILVTVGYRAPTAGLLSDAALDEAIEQAEKQMAPEYEVMGTVERLDGGVAIFFTIMERDATNRRERHEAPRP